MRTPISLLGFEGFKSNRRVFSCPLLTCQKDANGSNLWFLALPTWWDILSHSWYQQVYRQVPHGELLNRGEFREKFGAQLSLPRQQLGAVQMPFLRDANTGSWAAIPNCMVGGSFSGKHVLPPTMSSKMVWGKIM